MTPDERHKAAEPKRPTLSLCMIVRDEAAMLGECLESAAGLADEIVVVDTGSEDGTREIARSYGARVIRFVWRDDFSAARNASLDAATGDWILWLDADERLRKAEHDRLRGLIMSGSHDAYLVPILSPKPNGSQVTRGHRLFRKDRRVRFAGRVHEQIGPSLERAGYRVGAADIAIDHLGYNLAADKQRGKNARNLRLLELARDERPRDAYVRFTLAQCYIAENRDADAEEELKIALGECDGTRVDKPLPRDIRASAQSNLASIALKRGAHVEALRRTAESRHILPEQVMAHVVAYQAHRALGDDSAALDDLRAAARFLEMPPRHGGAAIEPTLDPADLERRIADCCLRLGRTDEARETLEKTLAARPDETAAPAMLARCANAGGKPDEAWTWVDRACAAAPEDESLLDLAAFVLLKQGRFSEAADRLARLCVRRPDDFGLRRRLAGVLMKAGKTREAADVMASLQASGSA